MYNFDGKWGRASAGSGSWWIWGHDDKDRERGREGGRGGGGRKVQAMFEVKDREEKSLLLDVV